jgi:PrtD family type I secretion system ABC transporter
MSVGLSPGMRAISTHPTSPSQRSELGAALRQCRVAFAGVWIASALVNMLTLAGSLYMLQVYDRVLPSRSVPTLVGLTVLVLVFYVAFGFFDLMRMQLLGRIGARVDRLVRERIFRIFLDLPLRLGAGAEPNHQALRDLDQVRNFLSSLGPASFFDLPWMPVFLFTVYLMHPLIGMLATAGAILVTALTLITERMSQAPTAAAGRAGLERHAFAESSRRNAEAVKVMGIRQRVADRWAESNQRLLAAQQKAATIAGTIGTASRAFRMFLQSAVLGLGAYLVIRQEATAGIIIVSAIIVSRALAPVETAIANWKGFIAARQSYRRLGKLLAAFPAAAKSVNLPLPKSSLEVDGVCVAPPGEQRIVVQGVSFTLKPGAGLGIIGPSASGKTSLVRALVGAWPTARGSVRLDGATPDQWDSDDLGRAIGYLPQDFELFGGTVAENIARFDPDCSSEKVIAAAQSAGIHDLIVHLPQGYDTLVGEGGSALSGGQRQRIGLARALYGDPFLVVLDEPNSNLDADGESALTGAILGARRRGAIVIVVAHRPSAIGALESILVLQEGRQVTVGPKEEVLRAALRAPVAVPEPSPLSEPARAEA